MSRDHALLTWADDNGVTLQLVRVNHADDTNSGGNGTVFKKGKKGSEWDYRSYIAILSMRGDFTPMALPGGHTEGRRSKDQVLVTDFSAGVAVQKRSTSGVVTSEGICVGDVLSSLVIDATTGEDTFREFCDSYGADDAVEAHRIWKACRRQRKKVLRWLGSEAKLDELREAAQNW